MPKNFAVRLKCPYGDHDEWVILPNREETLSQILETPWDFECPVHGVQQEIPLEASEKGLAPVPKPAPAEVKIPRETKPRERSSKRVSLRLPVLAYGWARDESAFHEETTTLLVNASGSLIALAAKVRLGETIFLVNKATQEEQECRVAYLGPEVEGKARVGVAFKNAAPSFWRTGRQESRTAVPKALRVWVRGVDRNGNPFLQSAHVIDVSPNGARLEGVGHLTWPGEIIEVKRRWRKANFRVVWVGEIGRPQANQIGICALEPSKNIWGVRLS